MLSGEEGLYDLNCCWNVVIVSIHITCTILYKYMSNDCVKQSVYRKVLDVQTISKYFSSLHFLQNLIIEFIRSQRDIVE